MKLVSMAEREHHRDQFIGRKITKKMVKDDEHSSK